MTTAAMAYGTSNSSNDYRNELVMSELPRVHYVAARIRERLPNSVELEDLVQAGVIGLLEASRNYDPTKDALFSTFARFRIRGAILDSLRKLDWGSRTLRKKGRAISESIARLEGSLGRHPHEDEIALDLQMSVDELQKATTQLDGLYLVGQLVGSSDDPDTSFDLIESAQSAGGDNPFDLCLEGEMKAHLAKAVSQMSEREQLILSLYYQEELTMKEVSQIVGIAVSRVSQIHATVTAKLRALLSHLQEPEAGVEHSRTAMNHGASEARLEMRA
jgi:RNA polymerase sigma factor for flagellar operon FliA